MMILSFSTWYWNFSSLALTESQQCRIFAQTAASSSGSSGCIPSGLFVNEGNENQI